MTNEQILKTQDSLLTTIERQKKFLLGLALRKMPCPVCANRCDQFEAARITIDEYPFGVEEPVFRCTNVDCGIALMKVIPLFGGPAWGWIVKRPAEQADRAKG
jgi:hypothetical protein